MRFEVAGARLHSLRGPCGIEGSKAADLARLPEPPLDYNWSVEVIEFPRSIRYVCKHLTARATASMKASKPAKQPGRKSAALVGMAFDAEDGQTRLTRGKNFVLCGGSDETHAVMQETAIKVNETLDRQGRRLEDVSLGELRDIICDRMAR